jgi:hypothetical protein
VINDMTKKAKGTATNTQPAFPYCDRPGTLRRFLGEVPRRPRPLKVNGEYLSGLRMGGNANATLVRVLKALGFVNEHNQPTELYAGFMHAGTGPAIMAKQVRATYPQLFAAHHRPDREPNDSLRNLFNIHSGGAERTIDLQIQTFRALCENADFDATGAFVSAPAAGSVAMNQDAGGSNGTGSNRVTTDVSTNALAVHIDLHIHLPPGKSARDYQYIIQDIARYLYQSEPIDAAEGIERAN